MSNYSDFVRETNRNQGPFELQEEDAAIHGAVSELVAETGEVAEVIQKANRNNGGILTTKDHIRLYGEAGDVLWGVQSLLNVLPGKNTMEDLIEFNMIKLQTRRAVEAPDMQPYPLIPSALRPGDNLNWGVRTRPTRFDWIVRNGTMVSQHGLPDVPLDGEHGCGTAYRLSRMAGDIDRPIIFGVYDDAGPANLGGRYSRLGSPAWQDMTWLGETEASATFVGLSPIAEVGLTWGYNGNRTYTTKSVEAYDIGIRNYNGGVYIVRCNGHDRPGDAATKFAQLDGVWWLGKIAESGQVEQVYLSGLHADDHDVLIIRNMKHRGKRPEDPGLDFKEHSNGYIKSVFLSILFENNDCYGGNRSGMHIRPDSRYNALPTARIMVRDNYGDDIGSNWVNPSGGAVLTIWASFNGLYVYNNHFRNFRYKALAIGGQPSQKNYDYLESGNQHKDVYVGGNTFLRGPQTGQRATMSISACDRVTLMNDNVMTGQVVLDSETNDNYNGLKNVVERLVGPWDYPLHKFDDVADEEVLMTYEQILDRMVRQV